MPATRARIEDNLRRIRENIAGACARAGRSQREVSIVAVTKSVDLAAIRLLPELGLTDLGENRVQQLVSRAEELRGHFIRASQGPLAPPQPRWHMIGHLQRNKAKPLIGVADVIHSIDSLRLAEDLSARAVQAGATVDVFIEVNCSAEPRKFGLPVGAASHMAGLICTLKNLRLLGFMTMAPRVREPEQARPTFARLREVFDEMLRDKAGGPFFQHLSMGMSQDYTIAVEEGATVLRIGTALFE
jgi:PLP dependent protein